MHHVILERWSRGSSVLHARDPRVKIALLLFFLIALATTSRVSTLAILPYGFVLALGIAISRLPARGLLGRAALVLPFSAAFALVSIAAGDAARGTALVARSYLSATAVLLIAGTTPLPHLLRGLEWLRVPSFLLLVLQFLYRYLFVVSEQGQHMRQAAACRAGSGSPVARFRGAAGAVAVLFARSFDRAQGIHQAMLARGFDGRIRLLVSSRAGGADAVFLLIGALLIAACRLGPETLR